MDRFFLCLLSFSRGVVSAFTTASLSSSLAVVIFAGAASLVLQICGLAPPRPRDNSLLLPVLLLRPSLAISSRMVEHSFSSSATRCFMPSMPSRRAWFSLAARGQPPPPRCCSAEAGRPSCLEPPSRFSEIMRHSAMELRSWSCSKKRTCTMTRRGRRSFCAAWVQASRESFWQSITRQSSSFSDSDRWG